MDILYTLGTGSTWQNNELRFSLRSIEKYVYNIGHVFIVGEDPGFLQGVTILPYPDVSKYNKEKNIFDKIIHATQQEYLGENFAFFNDDHFLLQPVELEKTPYWYSEPLVNTYKRIQAGNAYRVSLKNTAEVLHRHHHSTINFDTHLPIVYNKKKLQQVAASYNWDIPFGYVIKSLYCNHCEITGDLIPDLKINKPHTLEHIAAMLHNRPAFSIGDGGLTTAMKALLQQKYPTPSRWELPG